jgi:hypothetical protein
VGGVGDEGALAVHGSLDRAQGAPGEPESGAKRQDDTHCAAGGKYESEAAKSVPLRLGAAADLKHEAHVAAGTEWHQIDAELVALGRFGVDEGGAAGEGSVD